MRSLSHSFMFLISSVGCIVRTPICDSFMAPVICEHGDFTVILQFCLGVLIMGRGLVWKLAWWDPQGWHHSVGQMAYSPMYASIDCLITLWR